MGAQGRHRGAMIEAFAILAVFLTASLIYLGARLQAQNDSLDPHAEEARLRESLAWHEDRLKQAQERRWDADMTGRIAEQLAEIQGKLARFQVVRANAIRRRQEW
jgi:hypothetical protein